MSWKVANNLQFCRQTTGKRSLRCQPTNCLPVEPQSYFNDTWTKPTMQAIKQFCRKVTRIKMHSSQFGCTKAHQSLMLVKAIASQPQGAHFTFVRFRACRRVKWNLSVPTSKLWWVTRKTRETRWTANSSATKIWSLRSFNSSNNSRTRIHSRISW